MKISIERLLRGIAGLFIILSVVLSFVHSKNWLYFTLFVGLNLFQSSITNWCPMITILEKFGFKRCDEQKNN